MGSMETEFERNRAALEQNGMDFVRIELELALTFCRISKETRDPQKRLRTLHHAERAYKTASGAFKVFNLSRRGINADCTGIQTLLNDVDRELAHVQ